MTTTSRSQRRRTAWRTAVSAATACLIVTISAATADAATIPNPLGGIAPNFGLFGEAMDSTWKRLVAFIWALVLIIIATMKASEGRVYRYPWIIHFIQ